jgi:adenylosuccinate lyase
MLLNPLNAITPIDGRYTNKTSELQSYFSEASLINFRVEVEIEYFISLCNIPLEQLNDFPKEKILALKDIYENFSSEDAIRVKKIEGITNHDVKAVEYFIKEEFDKLNLEKYKEFIHFGLTSQDINNTAIPYSIRKAFEEVYLPKLFHIVDLLKERAKEWEDIPLLARTHGQAASPTRMGKELQVFIERIEKQISLINSIPFTAKFGGATGNFNAHHVAYPNIDWKVFADKFTFDTLKLKRQQTTTQIEHYDNLAALMDNICRINTILIDFSRDIWSYVSMEYFKQKIRKGEIGSSAMPHKVNPIDFENAEGNLGMANAVFNFLSSKLPISRLQRDLTDSTVLRNIGVPFAHSLIAIDSLNKGIKKLLINKECIVFDLEKNWAVVAEAIQTVLRREGYPKPYEALKELTRKNTDINKKSIHDFIQKLKVKKEIKDELKKITPMNYTGI